MSISALHPQPLTAVIFDYSKSEKKDRTTEKNLFVQPDFLVCLTSKHMKLAWCQPCVAVSVKSAM